MDVLRWTLSEQEIGGRRCRRHCSDEKIRRVLIDQFMK
jgi:hypothetical protein